MLKRGMSRGEVIHALPFLYTIPMAGQKGFAIDCLPKRCLPRDAPSTSGGTAPTNNPIPLKPELILSLPAQPIPYAVLGQPIRHSLSPAMQQAAFDHLGISARYFRIEVGEEGLPRAVEHMRQVPFGGWNCTVPNKVKMMELCDQLSPTARELGAVNTVINESGVLVGHNTDGLGWGRALREAFERSPSDLRILILGAGGAARAIAGYALQESCPSLLIANRNRVRAEQLVADLTRHFPLSATQVLSWNNKDLSSALREIDLVVNATSAGLQEREPPVLRSAMIPPELLVYDTLYGTSTDKLRLEAESAGAKWSDGLGMLLHQGAASFSLWVRREAPLEVMRQALASAFSASRP
jgi:shikimate dehydrogenase